jgi:hypothetical protein
MPLCRRHRHYHTMPDGRNVPFCRDCHDRQVRRERLRLISGAIVAPEHDRKEGPHG